MPATSRSWTPILTGSLHDAAVAAVDEIRLALQQPAPAAALNLSGGSAGLALFFSYLGEAYAGHALDLLAEALEGMASHQQVPSLYGGFTGVAWALEHLRGRLFEDDGEDPLTTIDEALATLLDQRPWRRDYDLISGLVGYGRFALDRQSPSVRTALIEKIVERLSEMAIARSDGITWFTSPDLLYGSQRSKYPRGYYNLGLAHGVPGVIALLGEICAAQIAVARARPLLDGAVRWLLSQRNPEGRDPAFGCFVHDDVSKHDRSSRLAWCYGDLGISVALLWAARNVGEPVWERQALDLARRCAERYGEDSGVRDAGLCHGAAGNAQLFNRLYQATRDSVFLDAARRWFARALAMRRPGEGVAGFAAWRALESKWEAFPGLLEGAAGIGLALTAAVSSVEPEWDRMLMVSVPPIQ